MKFKWEEVTCRQAKLRSLGTGCLSLLECINNMKFAACLAETFFIFIHILSVLFCIILSMFVGKIWYKYILSILLVMHVLFWLFCFIVVFRALFV